MWVFFKPKINYNIFKKSFKTLLKNDCERKVSIIEAKLVEMSAEKDWSIGPLLDKALKNLSRIPELYQINDYEGKRRIISSMYPQKK